MRKLLMVMAVLVALSPAAFAAKAQKADKPAAPGDPVAIGTFGNWKAYTFTDDSGKVCFMSTAPHKQEGKFKKRGDVLLFITHWAGAKTKNVVSVSAGYAYKDGSKATLKIDGHSFDLATVDETAWARDRKTDDALTAALRKGSTLVVTGASKHGTKTKDTYSLKGSSEAYNAITKGCGL